MPTLSIPKPLERVAIRIDYRRKNFERWSGDVMVRGIIAERSMILIECDVLEDGQRRHFRLDHVERATVRTVAEARSVGKP